MTEVGLGRAIHDHIKAFLTIGRHEGGTRLRAGHRRRFQGQAQIEAGFAMFDAIQAFDLLAILHGLVIEYERKCKHNRITLYKDGSPIRRHCPKVPQQMRR